MMNRACEGPGPCWNYYITVDDVAAAARRATEKGGEVILGPHEVPGGARIVQARDPQGAHFAVISGPN
jgi:predicted enzyme related to lactoylglutathione lyase